MDGAEEDGVGGGGGGRGLLVIKHTVPGRSLARRKRQGSRAEMMKPPELLIKSGGRPALQRAEFGRTLRRLSLPPHPFPPYDSPASPSPAYTTSLSRVSFRGHLI